MKVKLFVEDNSKPKFFKACTLPLALCDKVSDELDNLQANGVIVPVKFSPWAAPVVPIIKHDGNVRLCGDYKLTINSVAKNEVYPYPELKSYLHQYLVARHFQSWTCRMLTCSSNGMSHLKNM